MYVFLVMMLAASPGQNYCELCHSDVKVQYQVSVHAREGLTCVDCHGGNSSTDSQQAAHQGNFRPLNDKQKIPEMCASCHSDRTRMRAYALPTDQLDLYRTSEHGRALARGDKNVAVCTDCHGVHKMLPPSDPEATTHPRNIPRTCGRCHDDEKLMSQYKIPATVVAQYRNSVHGQALESGNLQAPVCTSCHGAHGAAPPGVGDVAIVCGHCHQAERANFRKSPHPQAMAKAGIAECAGCHGNHDIQRTNHSMWSTMCAECHAAGSQPAEVGQKIQAAMTQAQAEIQRADVSIDQAMKIPLEVSDYQARLEEARTYMVEVLPASHGLSLSEIDDLTRRARSVAEEIQSEVHERENVFQGRRVVLIIIWLFIVLTIVVLYQYRKHLESGK